ncbi:MAG: hypothetical protein F2737_04480 [Actinobacteria bacterium]|uniref:Unannotated protein n=1 Tax=freshwater metagenome TaxID=449393 RepID=A0A6J6XSM6_9ZZZZ|nr:hypothetical protein [Actinomycetota bacterium]
MNTEQLPRQQLERGSWEYVACCIPLVVLAAVAWSHRWLADDAFVNLRIVRQLEHGNGLVFNLGDRVEAGTSPLWIFILAVTDGVTPFRLEWIAVVLGLGTTLLGLWLAMDGTLRTLDRRQGAHGDASPLQRRVVLPVGLLLYIALPPAWDFATSGLENGLGVLWIGWCWRLLAGQTSGAAEQRAPLSWPTFLLLGIAPFIRPDFGIFMISFGVAAILLGDRSRRNIGRTIAWIVLIPILGTLLRTAYFGIPVPNTAIAKEATLSSWGQGWRYLQDFFRHSWLLPPLLGALAVFGAPLVRSASEPHRRRRILVICSTAGALAHGLFVVRAGGDFMHARLLLPSLLVLLLPIAVAQVNDWRWVATALVLAWAIVAGTHARAPYSGPPPAGKAALPAYAIDPATYIADERLVHMRLARTDHPVTLDDYAGSLWGKGGLGLSTFARAGGTGFLVDPSSNASWKSYPLAAVAPAEVKIVSYVGAVGMYSYAAPLDVWVLDRFGLSNSVSAHQRLTGRGRPGHEKDLPVTWMFAEFASRPYVGLKNLDPVNLQAAEQALNCGSLRDLRNAQRNSLGAGQIWRNLTRSWSLWRFRMPTAPVAAAGELCD